MSGFADLLFFGFMLWLVLRAAGRAGQEMRRTSQDGSIPEGEADSAEGTEDARPVFGRRPEASRGEMIPPVADPLAELRRRIAEAQRRQAEREARRRQIPTAGGRQVPVAEKARPRATPREAEMASLPTRAPSPARAPETAVRARSESPPSASARTRVGRPRHGSAELPDFGRFSPLTRAIVYAEILGPPRALDLPAAGPAADHE